MLFVLKITFIEDVLYTFIYYVHLYLRVFFHFFYKQINHYAYRFFQVCVCVDSTVILKRADITFLDHDILDIITQVVIICPLISETIYFLLF